MQIKTLYEPQNVDRKKLDLWIFAYLLAKNESNLSHKAYGGRGEKIYCWQLMNQDACYLMYYENQFNSSFSKISDLFFKYLFWNGEIYVNYEKNKEIINVYMRMDINILEKMIKEDIERSELNENFQTIQNRLNVFMNLENGGMYEIVDWENHLIKVEWIDPFNFEKYWRAACVHMSVEVRIHQAFEFRLPQPSSIPAQILRDNKKEIGVRDSFSSKNELNKNNLPNKVDQRIIDEIDANKISSYMWTCSKYQDKQFSKLEPRIYKARQNVARLNSFAEEFFKKYSVKLEFDLFLRNIKK